MGRVLACTTVQIAEDHVERARKLLREVDGNAGGIPGRKSISLWRDLEAEGRFATVGEYDSAEDVEKQLETLDEGGLLETILEIVDSAPDLRIFRIDGHSGLTPQAAPLASFMSLSIRRADPGLGAEIESEVSQIFESLAFTPGYLGGLWGPNLALEEEVLGMALWETREAYASTLPAKPIYELMLFERIA